MNKAELVNVMAEKAGLTKVDAKKALDAFIEAVTEALKAGDKISLVGFGSFEVKNVPAKEGINPATGAKIKIAASKKPVLKFGKAYKDIING